MTRPIALALTLLTGFSGLVYEVTWQKYLAALLGSHSEATAAVLAIYLGGLAAGYALFGRVTRRAVAGAAARGERPRLLWLYGQVESGIGLYAVLFPFAFSGVQALSVRIPHVGEGLAFSLDVVLTVLLIGPPTILMGGTIPVLTQALSQRLAEATRVHAWIYACNTAGAFLGALAGAFLLIPWLGLDGVMWAMGALNLAAGASFAALGRRPFAVGAAVDADEPVHVPERFGGYAAVVLLAGFAMMCVQTALNRVGGLALGASHFTFAMVVAVFVLCIALGSFAVSLARRIPPLAIVLSQWLLVGLLLALYLELENATYYAHVVRALFVSAPAAFHPYYAAVFLGMLAVLLVPIGLSGALLPLVFHHLRDELGGIGGVAGRLYAWNTLGSLLGALLGGYALLFVVDLHHVFAIALAALLIGTGILTTLVLHLRPWLPGAVVAVLLVGCAALPRWDPGRMSAGLFRQREATAATFAGPDALYASRRDEMNVAFYDDDPTSTVTVIEGSGGSYSILTNGKSDGNIRFDYTTMAMVGLVPALFADDPSRAFVVGWGLGVTAGVLGALDSVQEVVAVEISPAVLEAAHFFDDRNQHASRNPKIAQVRSDAYRALLRSDEQFGVIASEPSNPWVMGVEMLYSEEFLRAARARLTPGGAYAQWLHTYSMDAETLGLAIRTFQHVFGDMIVFFTRGSDILLLGLNDPSRAGDLDALRARFDQPDFRAGFGRADVTSFLELAAHELLPLGVIGASELPGPLHTIRHPILSDSAARAFFAGHNAEVPRMALAGAVRAGAPNSLLRRVVADDPADEDRLETLSRHVCSLGRQRECAILLAYWTAHHPGSARLAEVDGDVRAAERGAGGPRYGVGARLAPPEIIERLARLYRGEAVDNPTAPGPLNRAIYTTDLYRLNLLHGYPFPRAALADAWRQCNVPRCRPAYQTAVSLVGPIIQSGDAAAGS